MKKKVVLKSDHETIDKSCFKQSIVNTSSALSYNIINNNSRWKDWQSLGCWGTQNIADNLPMIWHKRHFSCRMANISLRTDKQQREKHHTQCSERNIQQIKPLGKNLPSKKGAQKKLLFTLQYTHLKHNCIDVLGNFYVNLFINIKGH